MLGFRVIFTLFNAFYVLFEIWKINTSVENTKKKKKNDLLAHE